MLRDLAAARSDEAEAVLDVIASAAPDVLLLLDVDWDVERRGLDALAERLAEHGLAYPHRLALRPNSGAPSGIDLDGDGDAHRPRDALGYGWFTGDSGMALLSRLPLGEARDESGVLWSARSEAVAVLPEVARTVVPLATTAQWVVPLADRRVTIVTLAAGTPVFDGPEDRNGLRNKDEVAFAMELAASVEGPVVMGRGNLDPERGEGDRATIRALLEHPALQDPLPGQPTVEWESTGPMRVDYVLPAAGLDVVNAGIVWPAAEGPLAEAAELAGPGRLVWVDVTLP